MRVFIAGGTGAIGRPLVAALAVAGHEVAVYSRDAGKVTALGVPGIVPAVGDAFDADALIGAVQSIRPEVVVNELTSLPQTANPLTIKRGFDRTSRLRREVSKTLVTAARAAGARRIVAQSIAFAYRPGPGTRTEADPLWTDAKGQIGVLTGSVATLESHTLGDAQLEGVVLRYGSFYGPGTYFAPDGLYATMLKRRVLPIPGKGGGIFGLVPRPRRSRGHRCRARGTGRHFQRGGRRAGACIGGDGMHGASDGRQATAPRARGARPHRGRRVPRLPAVRSAGRLERASPDRAGLVAALRRLARRAHRRVRLLVGVVDLTRHAPQP
jgi:hypothetical protein